MKNIVRAVLLLGSAWGVAAGQESSDIFAKAPYTGTVRAQVLEPDRASAVSNDSGTGTARFVPLSDGRLRFEVQGSIRRSNDSGFAIEGSRNASGWSGGRAETLSIMIDRQGRISGGGIDNQHRITFGGQASADRMNLTVQTEKLARAAGDTRPAGTRIVFNYDLKRDAALSAQAEPSGDKSKKTCKRRVWKMVNVTTPGGGMTMTQIPYCVD